MWPKRFKPLNVKKKYAVSWITTNIALYNLTYMYMFVQKRRFGTTQSGLQNPYLVNVEKNGKKNAIRFVNLLYIYSLWKFNIMSLILRSLSIRESLWFSCYVFVHDCDISLSWRLIEFLFIHNKIFLKFLFREFNNQTV